MSATKSVHSEPGGDVDDFSDDIDRSQSRASCFSESEAQSTIIE